MNPIDSAKELYCLSLKSLMAHSIRAVENKFKSHRLDLDLVIKPMDLGGLHGVLTTRLWGKTIQQTDPRRVTAEIYLNSKATKQLARFTIAHEIYHLLLELDQWVSASDKRQWNQLQPTREMEHDCNRFAQALCYLHDRKLYRDEKNLEKNVYFDKELFEREITLDDDGMPILPSSYALGEGVHYHGVPDPDLSEEKFPWDN